MKMENPTMTFAIAGGAVMGIA
ncbi:protease FtsH-inhibitory lysogeny factor CIII, partial [Salmonella enterica subsp. enterica]|nr:protease FtsH-inhibitory lysogeny factor CIII [Salmonella enterica subsp. enterica]ECG9711477.1 protease FtsH-inhibitory lysogeny factor CIII [Salmonella enterica subsp. enterica serovar Mbandaka]ECG5516303.1 protease FtsH-inhibitory lysogeny factor CIII [Salmonella enterica subsp. enterica]ECG9711509.1 protease FtsH-inhibitory lysogeny factor CIII [Salmonella enterica subsp. enterica serovar Mbandaka]ECT2823312.1 protease FtsH-inhibitory lysogeny factor CIII [Salmonella enterica subsp. ente